MWFSEMNILLDSKLDTLQRNPASSPDDCSEKGTGYPIEWTEMLGRIFHKVVYKYRDRVLNTADIRVPQLQMMCTRGWRDPNIS